jgi:hypothetical protein
VAQAETSLLAECRFIESIDFDRCSQMLEASLIHKLIMNLLAARNSIVGNGIAEHEVDASQIYSPIRRKWNCAEGMLSSDRGSKKATRCFQHAFTDGNGRDNRRAFQFAN